MPVPPGAATPAKATVTLSDGRTAPFTVVGTDPADDIAVIRAENLTGLTPITIGSSKDLKVGQNVVAIGSPAGPAGHRHHRHHQRAQPPGGHRGPADRSALGDECDSDRCGDHPGNSGGRTGRHERRPDRGELRHRFDGFARGQAGSIGLGFAIPVDQAKRIADQLVSTGTVQRAALGVKLSSDDDGRGAVIAGVQQGSPAADGRDHQGRRPRTPALRRPA